MWQAPIFLARLHKCFDTDEAWLQIYENAENVLKERRFHSRNSNLENGFNYFLLAKKVLWCAQKCWTNQSQISFSENNICCCLYWTNFLKRNSSSCSAIFCNGIKIEIPLLAWNICLLSTEEEIQMFRGSWYGFPAKCFFLLENVFTLKFSTTLLEPAFRRHYSRFIIHEYLTFSFPNSCTNWTRLLLLLVSVCFFIWRASGEPSESCNDTFPISRHTEVL